MVDQDNPLKFMFPRLTPLESAHFSGTRMREITQFANDLNTGNGINTAHLSYFLNIVNDFYSATTTSSSKVSNNISFEDGRLTPQSLVTVDGWGIAKENHRGKILTSLNKFSAFAGDTGFFLSARPYPVKWHLDHIKDRMSERNPSRSTDIMFSNHNIVALAMLQIFEEEHENGQTDYHPFVLPERGGVILGHTMRILPEETFNRIHLTLPSNASLLPLGAYTWFPTMHMVPRTFIGMDDLSPQMQALRLQLLKFYTPNKIESLVPQLSLYMENVSQDFLEDHPVKESYFDAMVELSNVMNSPLWKRTVRLPLHLRTSGHNGPAGP